MNFRKKNIIIVEGADASGKSQLVDFLRKKSEGKCHILHSNFSKDCKLSSHKNQHKLITKFIKNNFSEKYYTGNNNIILDRNYISDIIYGIAINCGSSNTYDYKMRYLNKLLKKISNLYKVQTTIIYCRPSEDNFGNGDKIELPNRNQHEIIKNTYDDFFNSLQFKHIINKLNINYIIYDYTKDNNYSEFTKKFESIKPKEFFQMIELMEGKI